MTSLRADMARFTDMYGESSKDIRQFFGPGRVNLIGEHIDYNGGLVMPAAISLGITATCRPRCDRTIQFASAGESLLTTVDLDGPIEPDPARGWGNYPAGIVHELRVRRLPLQGADVLFTTTLPQGAGLSSSAAIEVLTAFLLLTLAGNTAVDLKMVALLCQTVENTFIGVNSGIMDQFSVALGKRDCALLLDCAPLAYQYVPFQLDDCALLIMDTRKTRRLTDSKYNERRTECDRVLGLLGTKAPPQGLAHAEWTDVVSCVEDPVLLRRARHVITEQARVTEAAQRLAEGNLPAFGQLLNGSHASLRDDYEVSGFHLDTIVAAAQEATGCLGARMTGAGFGGCALALVRSGSVDAFTQHVRSRYMEATGLDPAFYVAQTSDGVHEVTRNV